MRYREILAEKKHKRRKPRHPTIRYGYWYGGYMSATPDGSSSDGCDGGGDGSGGQ